MEDNFHAASDLPISMADNSIAGSGSQEEKAVPFETVLEKHSSKIYALACRLLGTSRGAEDLAQESLIQAFRFYSTFRKNSSVETWLYRITVNAWKNNVRSEKRRGILKIASLFQKENNMRSIAENTASKELPLDNTLEQSENSKMIQQALRALSGEERVIVILRDLENKSYSEIAAILFIPEGTVKSRLSRAREILRQILTGRIS